LRQKEIDTFQKDDRIPAFLLSLKAGGLGVILTAADYKYGFKIIDLADIKKPKCVNSFDTRDNAFSVTSHRGYACVAEGGAGLRMYDVRNPDNATCVTPKTLMTHGTGAMCAAGDHVYFSDSTSFEAVDISSPLEPVMCDTIYTTDADIEICRIGDLPTYPAGIHGSGC
jgi:hypothetical protein